MGPEKMGTKLSWKQVNRFRRGMKGYWSALPRRFGTSQALADAFWILLLIGTLLLIRIGMPVTRMILLAGLSIFVLRFAPRIPGLRWVWVGLFGERTFWDWMTLLCAPILLSSIGVLISTSINDQQSDVSITKERLGLANEYYNKMSELILTPEFQALIEKRRQRAKSIEKLAETTSKETPEEVFPSNNKEHCNPIPNSPLASIAYSRTSGVLRTLKNLKTSKESHTPMQQSILQLLFYSGLIERHGHVVSLQQTKFSGAAFESIDLSNSCFDSVNFDGAFMKQVRLTGSNLMRSNFKAANLNQAKLNKVNLSKKSNLIGISGVDTDFSGSDLRDSQFDNAILHRATFMHSDLRGASFSNADLRNANFWGADLRNADFRGADLRGADLRETKMNTETNLEGAKYNTKRLDNTASAKDRQAHLRFLQSLKIDQAFDVKGLVPLSFILKPTQHDQTFSPSSQKMKLDHSL